MAEIINRSMHFAKKVLVHFIPAFDRRVRMREGVSGADRILEIGPSHNPLFPKKEGWNVETVDWLDQEGLKEHYKQHGVDLDKIEPVDYIWNGKSYSESIPKREYYDYIIASHVVEHTTNLAGFFRDCSLLLQKDGRLRLAVPDKRYIFDHFRDVTGLGEVLNNYYYPDTIHSAGMVGEYVSAVVNYKGSISWGKNPFFPINHLINKDLDHFAFCHSEKLALDSIRRVLENREYIDIHHYCFTPASFEYLIYELQLLGLIDLEIEKLYPSLGNEFIVTLRKSMDPPIRDDKKKKRLLIRRNRENSIT